MEEAGEPEAEVPGLEAHGFEYGDINAFSSERHEVDEEGWLMKLLNILKNAAAAEKMNDDDVNDVDESEEDEEGGGRKECVLYCVA